MDTFQKEERRNICPDKRGVDFCIANEYTFPKIPKPYGLIRRHPTV